MDRIHQPKEPDHVQHIRESGTGCIQRIMIHRSSLFAESQCSLFQTIRSLARDKKPNHNDLMELCTCVIFPYIKDTGGQELALTREEKRKKSELLYNMEESVVITNAVSSPECQRRIRNWFHPETEQIVPPSGAKSGTDLKSDLIYGFDLIDDLPVYCQNPAYDLFSSPYEHNVALVDSGETYISSPAVSSQRHHTLTFH